MKQSNQSILFSLLKELRKKCELTQEELSQKLGKPQSYVSKYESGEKRLDYFELREICQELKVEIAEFVTNLEERLTNES